MLDAIEFLNGLRRVCYGKKTCENCPLYPPPGDCNNCLSTLINYPEEAVGLIEIWLKENPLKTKWEYFLDQFPGHHMGEQTALHMKPYWFGLCGDKVCDTCEYKNKRLLECWRMPADET